MRRCRCSSALGKRSKWTRGPIPTSAARLADGACILARGVHSSQSALRDRHWQASALLSAECHAPGELCDMLKRSRCTNAPSQTRPLPHCQAPAQPADLASSEQRTLKPGGDRQHAWMQQTRCVQSYILAVQVVADSGSLAALNHIAVPTGRDQSRSPCKNAAHMAARWDTGPPGTSAHLLIQGL